MRTLLPGPEPAPDSPSAALRSQPRETPSPPFLHNSWTPVAGASHALSGDKHIQIKGSRAQNKNNGLRFPAYSLCAETHGELSTQRLPDCLEQVIYKLQVKHQATAGARQVETPPGLCTCVS